MKVYHYPILLDARKLDVKEVRMSSLDGYFELETESEIYGMSIEMSDMINRSVFFYKLSESQEKRASQHFLYSLIEEL